jgi:hypothetical protein
LRQFLETGELPQRPGSGGFGYRPGKTRSRRKKTGSAAARSGTKAASSKSARRGTGRTESGSGRRGQARQSSSSAPASTSTRRRRPR